MSTFSLLAALSVALLVAFTLGSGLATGGAHCAGCEAFPEARGAFGR